MSLRAIHLDFAQPLGPRRRWSTALLVLGVVALALATLRVVTLSTQVDGLAGQVDDALRASRHERRTLKPVAGDDKDAATAELARANLVIASLNLGWSALFKQLESVQVPHVTLLAVQPDAGNVRRLRLSGEARRLEDALAYVAQVARVSGFQNAHLVSHEAVASESGRQALQFALVVEWVGQP